MLSSTKRTRSEEESSEATESSNPIAESVLLGDPILEIFHRLGPASFVGQNAIYSVCRKWNTKLKQNGSWRKKVTPDGFIQSCSQNELLKLLSTGEAFRLFSFSNILELLSQHPAIVEACLNQEEGELPLNEEETDSVQEPNYLPEENNELFRLKSASLTTAILNNPGDYFNENISKEIMMCFALNSPRVALYVLENCRFFVEQLTDDEICSLGQTHPLVAMKILETPELSNILDGSHYVQLCYHGQAGLLDYILKTPRLMNMCIEEDLYELCRIQKICKNLQNYASKCIEELESEGKYAPSDKKLKFG